MLGEHASAAHQLQRKDGFRLCACPVARRCHCRFPAACFETLSWSWLSPSLQAIATDCYAAAAGRLRLQLQVLSPPAVAVQLRCQQLLARLRLAELGEHAEEGCVVPWLVPADHPAPAVPI